MAKKFHQDLIHNLVSSGAPVQSQQAGVPVKNVASSTGDEKMRTSYIVSKQANFKMKYIALKENRTISEMVDEALTNLITEWEKKTGESTPSL